jgi:hypothetical protein
MTICSHDLFVENLREKYPQSCADIYGGVFVGNGWFHIIGALVSNIHHYVKTQRNTRARDLLRNRACSRGVDAVVKFMSGGRELDSKTLSWYKTKAEEMIAKAPHHVTPKICHIRVSQIKEKFGGLRFYYSGGDDYIGGLVRMAESWAFTTCEVCGNPGEMRFSEWNQVLCDTHSVKKDDSYEHSKYYYDYDRNR